jgi:hypothetical protein
MNVLILIGLMASILMGHTLFALERANEESASPSAQICSDNTSADKSDGTRGEVQVAQIRCNLGGAQMCASQCSVAENICRGNRGTDCDERLQRCHQQCRETHHCN